jgi:penicillin-binding protein 2
MTARKGRFGYSKGESSPSSLPRDSWFDPSCFLIKPETVLEDGDAEKVRFTWGKALVALGFIVMLVRVTTLQIVEGAEHRFLAEGNRVRQQITLPPRGLIIDARGDALVKNEPGYSVDIIPSELPRKKDERIGVINQIAQLRNMDPKSIEKIVNKEGLLSSEPVVIDDTISREDAIVAKIKLVTTPGVRISFSPKRVYDSTPGLAHLLGYTARMNEQDITNHPEYPRSSIIGRSGLESSYDSALRGEVGTNEIEVNANGQYQRVLYTRPPQIGQTLKLTLDKGLQQEMSSALQEAMSKNGAKQAVGVAMDPKTGGILASVSIPTYDNNLFARGISSDEYKKLQEDPDIPLLNRAIHGLYPAGSTIKPFIAAAALEEGTITNKTTLDTSIGVIKIGQWEFPDWKVHGTTDVGMAIAESNDIFFYALGGGTRCLA